MEKTHTTLWVRKDTSAQLKQLQLELQAEAGRELDRDAILGMLLLSFNRHPQSIRSEIIAAGVPS